MTKHQAKRQARIERIAGRVARLEEARAELWRRVDELKAEHDSWIDKSVLWARAHPGANAFDFI